MPVRLKSEHYETWIEPNDYIIADLDGVVCIPGHLVEKVLEVIEPIVRADERCAEAISAGQSVEQAFKEFRGK